MIRDSLEKSFQTKYIYISTNKWKHTKQKNIYIFLSTRRKANVTLSYWNVLEIIELIACVPRFSE